MMVGHLGSINGALEYIEHRLPGGTIVDAMVSRMPGGSLALRFRAILPPTYPGKVFNVQQSLTAGELTDEFDLGVDVVATMMADDLCRGIADFLAKIEGKA